jgi:hypothetical protein
VITLLAAELLFRPTVPWRLSVGGAAAAVEIPDPDGTKKTHPCRARIEGGRVHEAAEGRTTEAAAKLLLKGTNYQWLKTHVDMRRKSAVEFRGRSDTSCRPAGAEPQGDIQALLE